MQQFLQNRELPKQASRFHSPKIERYKNLVDHYKKTLETLSRQGGEQVNGGVAVKHSLDFLLNKKPSDVPVAEGDTTKSLEFKAGKSPMKALLESIDTLSSGKALQRGSHASQTDYSTAATIIKSAKTEKFMLDYEQFKTQPKKQVFTYETKSTNAINNLFSEINNEMHRLGERIYATQVTNHKHQVIR